MISEYTPLLSKYYVEIETENSSKQEENIVFCVDTSGSMFGTPIQNVKHVLKDIYLRKGENYDMLCYDYNVKYDTISNYDSICTGGGTYFCELFTACKNRLLKKMESTTFIIMTDGNNTDGSNDPKLLKSIQELKLIISSMKHLRITFHCIGFGQDIESCFLETILHIGNAEGVLRYSSKSDNLETNFNDILSYIDSNEYTLRIGQKEYISKTNDNKIGFIVDSVNQNAEFKNKEWETILLTETKNPQKIINGLSLFQPESEEEVRNLLVLLHSVPNKGNNMLEKLQIEKIKKETEERMMEYISIFTQIKMGTVPEQIKLKLNSLRHDAKISNLNRNNKLDVRVNKNVEYFKKTDINGILKGYLKDITQEQWKEFRKENDKWMCVYSNLRFSEIMQRSPDNILCLGIYVERPQDVTKPLDLKLLEVSNTVISFDSFIDGINFQKKNNKDYITGSTSKEKINAVIPLNINHEHFKRIRILEGIWLGHLYTNDSYGYDKTQEVALLKLLYDMILMDTETQRYSQLLTEVKEMCKNIVNISEGFQSEYPNSMYNKYISGYPSRVELYIPLMVGYLRDDRRILTRLYCENLKGFCKKHLPDSESISKMLMYGKKEERVIETKEKLPFQKEEDADYIERSYIQFLYDKCDPVPLVSGTGTGEFRRKIVEADAKYILDLLKFYETPINLNQFFKYDSDNLDYELVRKKLICELNGINYNDEILKEVDIKLQGSVKDTVVFSLEEEETITNMALNMKSLEAFAGLMKKYADIYGYMFEMIVRKLIESKSKDKLACLMRNSVNGKKIYKVDCWRPLEYAIEKLEEILGESLFKEIEKENIDNKFSCRHVYRFGRLNRHGYGNSNINLKYQPLFKGYYPPSYKRN